MRSRRAVLAALALTAAGLALALIFGGKEPKRAKASTPARPGQPTVEFISPRNGSRQDAHSVVIKVEVKNFELAPARFGWQPELGQGNLRFSLNRVPDCVYPAKLQQAINSPLGKSRLKGKSFDYPEYAGPNGVLGRRLGVDGSYSPATRPEIYYHELQPGFYRVVVTLAQNNGKATQYHDVTTFQILPGPGAKPKACPKGKVSSSKAAGSFR